MRYHFSPKLFSCRALLRAAAILAIVLCQIPTAAQAQLSHLEKEKEFHVTVDSETFIENDSLTLANFADAELTHLGKSGPWDAVSVLKGGSKKDCIYYRETASAPGKTEMTWYIKYAAYQFGTSFPGHTYNDGPAARYELKIPLDFLDGATYRAVTGNPRIPTILEGELKKGQEAKVLMQKLWYIVFTKNGKSMTVDLNPVGNHNYGDKYLLSEDNWRLVVDENHFTIYSHMRRIKWGDTRIFKIVIRDGDVPYYSIHSKSKSGHYPYLLPETQIVFGTTNPDQTKFKLADHSPFSNEKGYGWSQDSSLELVETDFVAPLRRGYVKIGNEPTDYVVNTRNGLYLVTLMFGSSQEASDVFSVHANGKEKLSGLQTAGGAFIAKTIYAWVEDGRMKLSFTGGKCFLNALSLTPMVYNEEDYLFKRNWYVSQDNFDKWFSTVEPINDLPDIAQQASEDGIDWMWNASLESFNASEDCLRTTLDTPESLKQRLDLFQSGGFRAMIMGGLHMRYNSKESVLNKIMLRNTRMAVKAAHARGIKVIDHYDFNWVFYPGYPALMKFIDKDPNGLQRDILNPLRVSTAFCINSEAYYQELIEYLTEEQNKTNLDGYMLDEMDWINARYCACDTCRELFVKETGVAIPYDLDRGYFKNHENPIWREWIRWRADKSAAFFKRFIDEIKTIREDLVFMRYTSSGYARPSTEAPAMNEHLPWHVDYLGDEFHPDAMLLNWRVMFSRAKTRQGIASSWGNYPTWILPKPYTDAVNNTFYAWAVGRLNRENVWYRSPDYAWSKKLNQWQYQMKDKYAQPLSKVAILLSQYTRDYISDNNYQYFFREYTGWVQTMAQKSIQHDAILDRDLTNGKLDNYQVLILPNAALLGDREVEAVKTFVRSGKKVILSYQTGFFDESGAQRQTPAFKDILYIKEYGETFVDQKIVFANALNNDMEEPVLNTKIQCYGLDLAADNTTNILATNTVSGKPVAMETPYGQGSFYYIAGNMVSLNCETRMVASDNVSWLNGKTYKTHYDTNIDHMVNNIVESALGENYITKAVTIPDNVIYVAYEQKHNGQNSILLHLLNCQGKPEMKFGDPIIQEAPIAQPPLPHDITIALNAGVNIKKAFLATPLSDEVTPINFQKTGDLKYQLTIPKAALKNYAIVHITY